MSNGSRNVVGLTLIFIVSVFRIRVLISLKGRRLKWCVLIRISPPICICYMYKLNGSMAEKLILEK